MPAGFDVDLAFARDPWQFGDGEEVEVEVLVDGAESGRVVAELGEDAVVEHRDDGAVVVRLSVTDPEALVLWVLDLLDHAEVLGARCRARCGGRAARVASPPALGAPGRSR